MHIVLLVAAIDRPPEPAIVEAIIDAARARASVTVASPPGQISDLARHRGVEHVVTDDLEPLGSGPLAQIGSRRRARRVGRSLAQVLANADHVVLIGCESLPALTRVRRSVGVTLVQTAIALGSRRRLITHQRGRIDRVVTSDARTALAFGSLTPEIAIADEPAAFGATVIAGLVESESPSGDRAIVFAVPDYLPSLGGTTRQARNQALGVRDAGRRAIVVTQRIDRTWAKRQRVDRIEVVRLGPSSRHRIAMKLFVARAALWMRRHRDEILIVNAVMYPDLAVSAALAGLGRFSVVCWAGLGDATDTLGRGNGPMHRLLVAARRRALRSITHVALTPAIRDELGAVGVVERVHVIPTPIDLDRFAPPTSQARNAARQELQLADDDVAVVYVGQLRALKRVDQLLEAFAHVRSSYPRLRLFLVGGSREDLEDKTDDLRALAHQLELGAAVTFTGFTETVEPFLAAGDIFVLPSEREGLSNSLLEAMASGLACIAPASAGGDQVLTSETGIVPASNRAADLAEAMAALVADPARRVSMGTAASIAARQYSVEAVDAAYHGLYESLRPK
jgi:glycosyltransferase involved in cell wall biosynthesis